MLIGDLLLIAKRLQAAAHAAAIPAELNPRLTPGEISVLDFLIDQTAPVRVRDIVANSHLVQSRVSTVVQSLQRRGWVEIASDPADRRTTTVLLKREVAEAAHSALARSATGALQSVLRSATAAERKQIVSGLTLLATALRQNPRRSATS